MQNDKRNNPNLNQEEAKQPQKPKIKRTPTFYWVRYTISTSICLLFSFIYAVIAGIFSSYEEIIAKFSWLDKTDLAARMHILTDATFVSGMVMFGVGILVVASNGGAFEMFVYGMRRFISLFQRDVNKIRFKTFYDYHVYKSSEPNRSFSYMLVVGGAFIGIACIFLAVYMKYR